MGPARWWGRRMRSIRPTRDGWWCLFAALGLGVAAVNTGNNLAYLLCSMLLALVTVSGMLSDLSMRGLRLEAVLPEEIHAGRPALFGALIANRKRWVASYSIDLVIEGPTGGVHHLSRLAAGAERLCTWDGTLPRRGRQRLPGIRIATRFPFGLFVKRTPVLLQSDVLVYPAVGPVPRRYRPELGVSGERAARRRGRGQELYNLRPYRPGDEPHLIHWRTTARAGVVTVRELEEETALDTRIVLEGTGRRDAGRLERGLSEAASLAVHLCRAGAGVELAGPGVFVPLGRGGPHERRLLEALALYDPVRPAAGGVAPGPPAVRVVRVRLD